VTIKQQTVITAFIKTALCCLYEC